MHQKEKKKVGVKNCFKTIGQGNKTTFKIDPKS